MTAAQPLWFDLGDLVTGRVLDEQAWQHESRRRLERPYRTATGRVMVVYPFARSTVGIRTDAGEQLTVTVTR